MERKTIEFNRDRCNDVSKKAKSENELTAALAYAMGRSRMDYGDYAIKQFRRAIVKELGKDPYEIDDPKEFWFPALEKALAFLTDKAYAKRFPKIVEFMTAYRFSESESRRSYRSRYFRYHADRVLRLCASYAKDYNYQGALSDWIARDHDYGFKSFVYQLAIALKNGDAKIVEQVREALVGDNSQRLLSGRIVKAVVMSGNGELIDDLLKLLAAAKLQEGVRQQILENADEGSLETLQKILKFCIDENMFRFSGAVRALDCWTGLAESAERPTIYQKTSKLAYEVLSDESKIEEYLASDDNLEAYMALWGAGCREIADSNQLAVKLLDDPRPYRRILGWYYAANSDSEAFSAKLALRYLDETDKETIAWITNNLPVLWNPFATSATAPGEIARLGLPESAEERRTIFEGLVDLLKRMNGKKLKFDGNPFPWSHVASDPNRVANLIFRIARCDDDPETLEKCFDLTNYLSADNRFDLVAGVPTTNLSAKATQFLYKSLNDRSVEVKERAVGALGNRGLDDEAVGELCAALRSKSSSLRESIVSLLIKQPQTLVASAVDRLLAVKDQNQIQAGLELLIKLKEDAKPLIEKNRAKLEAIQNGKLSTQTEILLKQLRLSDAQDKQVEYTKENGYGLYDPSKTFARLKETPIFADAAEKTSVSAKKGKANKGKQASGALLTEEEYKAAQITAEELDALYARLDAVFVKHADYEYTAYSWFDGANVKVLFGDLAHHSVLPAESGCRTLSEPNARYDMLPFWCEFAEAFGEFLTNPKRYVWLYHLTQSAAANFGYWSQENDPQPWYRQFQEKALDVRHEDVAAKYKRVREFEHFVYSLYKEQDAHALYAEAVKAYKSALAIVGEENIFKRQYEEKNAAQSGGLVFISVNSACDSYVISADGAGGSYGVNLKFVAAWRTLIRSLKLSDEDFADWFAFESKIEINAPCGVENGLGVDGYLRAYDAKLITREELFWYLADPKLDASNKIKTLTSPPTAHVAKKFYEKYDWIPEVVKLFTDRMVEIESQRGELATDVTEICSEIVSFKGARHFCRLLAALGKQTFAPGGYYLYETTKKAVLSALLKRCRPDESDTPQSFAEALKATDISEARLVEAVTYAPQWAHLAEQVLGWKGLKSGVRFFHAHISEGFSAEKETETAFYSAIAPQQFNDGAFDKNWFFEAYEQLGEERFQTIYRAAKYITSGGTLHRRSQLYADAALGKLDAEKLRQEIAEKRNQEKLRAYALLPIEPGDVKEALYRYEFIQKFLKESKQFGAQKRESEKKACLSALDNLALSTGYSDVNRLIWQMESAKSESLQKLFEPQEIGEYAVKLTIGEDGIAALGVEKKGKTLKSVPKELAKNEIVLELKQAAQDFKEQKRRAVESMERAMIERAEFEPNELLNIMKSPALSPIASKLLWTSGGAFGRPDIAKNASLTLVGDDGAPRKFGKTLRLAHPHDLRQASVWAQWTRYFYDQKIVQPFKQVFREYYPITADEKSERTLSRRYAGHQVQPKRTVALLKSRGWTVDYDEGLQKVFYNENLVVRMFAQADWFSPADVESPTLETVEFFDRESGENVPLENVPPILFSEVMRDIDLVVSVAHVGGVDPEASASTVEMRVAIATELAKLLKLNNVAWIGSHAKIDGKLGKYSVHMGSGVVHAEGKGMIAIVAVQSQRRGRIFLPFADDDPKTAEIMTKIVMLAEDEKIKDAEILRQICE